MVRGIKFKNILEKMTQIKHSKKILVLSSTFPRWPQDTTPAFVFQLCQEVAGSYAVVALVPHAPRAKKEELLKGILVKRFSYFWPASLQKLCYDGGIIPNFKKSFLAKVQLPLLVFFEMMSAFFVMRTERPALIHAHWMLPQGFVGVILKKMFHVPLIVTVHGSDLFPLRNPLLLKLGGFIFKNADVITVNSSATLEEVVRRGGDAQKIRRIPMGINLALFKNRSRAKPKKYAKNKLLLSVGRLSDQKGLQYLITALPTILKKYPQAKLLIIGEGPYKSSLENCAAVYGVDSAVEFLGALTQEGLCQYYNFSDVFVMPSLATKSGTEGFGLSIAEAMASGCPVIGTDVGGIPDIITDRKTGLLVQQKNSAVLAKAVIDIFDNTGIAKKMSRNAAVASRKKYGWAIIGKRFAEVYDTLINS